MSYVRMPSALAMMSSSESAIQIIRVEGYDRQIGVNETEPNHE
jgi:hypothetical protein